MDGDEKAARLAFTNDPNRIEELEDHHGLRPESAAIITALLDSVLDDSTKVNVDEEALARFACGWITAEESDAVIAALSSSDHLRTRLLQMRRSLEDAAAAPSARDSIFENDAPLKRTMRAALKATVKALSRWNEACEKGRKKSGVSLEDRRSLRSILMGVGTRLRDSGLQPAFASHRGAAAKVMVEPGNVFAELTIQAGEDESLAARAKFSKPFEEPQEVSLYVVEPGGAWAWIGSSLARGSHWILETPDFAAMLGMDPGEAPSNCFALSEGRWFMPRGWAPLRISRDLEHRGIASPSRLRLRKSPCVRDGNFTMTFEFPDTLRQAFLEDQLTLSIAIGSTTFVLGAWPVRELSPSLEVEIKAPSMGLPDCEFEMHSAIGLMLRPM